MAASSSAIVETRDPAHERCVTLRIDRPQRRNALGPDDALDLRDRLARLQNDSSVIAIVITGTDGAFTAGADIHELNALSGDALTSFLDLSTDILSRVLMMPKIVIAAVNGASAGFGNHLAVCADLCVIRADAAFHFTGSAKSIPSMLIGTQLMPMTIGLKRAKSLYLRGGRVDAEEAVELGLCNEVVDADAWDARVAALAAEFQDKSSLTMAHNKFQLNQAAFQMLGASRLSVLAGSVALSDARSLAPGRLP